MYHDRPSSSHPFTASPRRPRPGTAPTVTPALLAKKRVWSRGNGQIPSRMEMPMQCCLMRRPLASPSPWPLPPPQRSAGPCDVPALETETRGPPPVSCSVLGTMPVPMAVSGKSWLPRVTACLSLGLP
uniref:Potassium voltage-gated channel subfamily C member 4 n=1 Tax=Molossus molossus TaxID=27622 RepID=A0A7J8CRB8_MOLMO|nr:potassium voltage-gated channel subfamily C member 4 [Molossus molossus]